MSIDTPFLVHAHLDQIAHEVGTGEHYDIPIGAVVRLRIVPMSGKVPLPVTSSKWTVKGHQIVDGSVQTTANSNVVIQENRVIQGGYSNDPSCIETAWSRPGTFLITVSGECIYKKRPRSFETKGSVTVHSPTFTFTNPQVKDPGFDNNTMATLFVTGEVKYNCDQVTRGGEIGFVQIVNGLRLRGTVLNKPQQSMGSRQNFLDFTHGSLFYNSVPAQLNGSIKTDDEPSQVCEGEEYTWYQIGDLNRDENYFMYLAYKAPAGPAIVRSYIVMNAVCHWHWTMGAVYENDEWGSEQPIDSEVEPWNAQAGWSMPSWTSNSSIVGNWRAYD